MDMVNFHSVLELDGFFTEAHREAGSRLARLIEYSLRLMASYVRGPKSILVVVLLVLNEDLVNQKYSEQIDYFLAYCPVMQVEVLQILPKQNQERVPTERGVKLV